MRADALAIVAESADVAEHGREVLTRASTTAEALREIVDVLPLETRDQEEQAAELAREVQRIVGELEAARKAIVAPVTKKVNAVNAAFRGPRKALEALRDKIKGRLAEAAMARSRALLEAQRKAEEAAQKRDFQEANAHLVRVQDIPERAPDGVAIRWTWEPAEVDLRKVPIEFLSLDLQRVRAEVRAQLARGADEPKINGIRFEKVASATVRKAT